MIYLIDKGFRIKSALNNPVNHCKCLGMYDECLCLGYKMQSPPTDNIDSEGGVDIYLLREQSPLVKPFLSRVSPLKNNVNDSHNYDDNIII